MLEPTRQKKSLMTLDESLTHLGWVVVEIGKLMVLMGEPANEMRQRLMADELKDMPKSSLEYALRAWKRGDNDHLPDFLQGNTRIGVFFPKPAELRQIAEYHIGRERQLRNRSLEEQTAYLEDVKANPDKYFGIGELVTDLAKRKVMA